MLVVAITGWLYFAILDLGSGGKDVYYVGLAGPFSGSFAEVGLSMRRGVELAIDEINQNKELGNIRLRLLAADDNSGLGTKHRAVASAR